MGRYRNISRIHGQTQGLKANQLHRLRRFHRRRVPPDRIISTELARDMADLSAETGRQIGLLLDRPGNVAAVIVGDGRALVLPDMGRQRGTLTRLSGLRLVHTHLHGSGLDQDDINDLALLRMDMVAVLLVDPDGMPPAVEAAYLLPGGEEGGISRMEAPHPSGLDVDFRGLIRSLEEELTRRQERVLTYKDRDRALLISVSQAARADVEERLAELAELAETAGLETVGTRFYRARGDNRRQVVSNDRVQEINILALESGADLLVFDQDLAPSQITRLAEQTELRIIDRTQLILDIFAQRAMSREGKLQVEMAQLNYLMPRLTRMDSSLSRLTGGIGARGPGETKLEIDRRRARERLARLKKELKTVGDQRGRHRARRNRAGLPIVSIVGYTNAGKSTLLNRLTQSEVLAENRLFATLDPTSRRLRFPRDRSIIITDTVGFIRDLPPDLIEAFGATLEELDEADLLLHVIDAASPGVDQRIAAVEDILADLSLHTKPMLRIFNKIDLATGETAETLVRRHGGIALCALDSSTFPPLIAEIGRRLGWHDLNLE